MMNTIDSLKSLIAANPDIMTGAAGSGDIKEASTALAAAALAHGISLDAQQIEQAFQAREAAIRQVQPLDDAALDTVSGGGSPWCMFTDGCYCFFTK